MLKMNGRHRNGLRWLGRTTLLFATLAVLFEAAGYSSGAFVSALICLVYIVWPVFLHRDLRKKSDAPSKGVGMLFASGLSSAVAASALGFAVPLLWLANGYRWDESGMVSGLSFLSAAAAVIPGNYTHKVSTIVTLLLVSALLLSMALALRPKPGNNGREAAQSFVRRPRAASVLLFWLLGFVLAQIFELLLILAKCAGDFRVLLGEILKGEAPTAWDMFLFYPALPFGLLMVAAMVVTARDVLYQMELPADAPPVPPDGRLEGMPVRLVGIRTPGFAAVALAGFLTVAGIYNHHVHVGIVAAGASTRALIDGVLSREALDRWIGEQRQAGRTPAEIAAAINENGFWSPDAPTQGLARLLPTSDEGTDGTDVAWNCPVTVAAGLVDAAELAAAPWPDMAASRPKDGQSQSRSGSGDSSAEEAEAQDGETPPRAVRYCLRVACPSPVAWQAPDAIALVSSHPSATPDWLYPIYFDLYADGVAAAPGGYCMVDGSLSDSYQG